MWIDVTVLPHIKFKGDCLATWPIRWLCLLMTTWPHPQFTLPPTLPIPPRSSAGRLLALISRLPPSAPRVNYETANFTCNRTQITIITSSAHHVPSSHCKTLTRGHHLLTSKWASGSSKLKIRHSPTNWCLSMWQPRLHHSVSGFLRVSKTRFTNTSYINLHLWSLLCIWPTLLSAMLYWLSNKEYINLTNFLIIALL